MNRKPQPGTWTKAGSWTLSGHWLRGAAERRHASACSRTEPQDRSSSNSALPPPDDCAPRGHGRAQPHGRRRRFRRLFAALAVALAASAFGAPALAQTPAHCNDLDPLELWCASLTVGSHGGGTVLGYNRSSSYGSISPETFPYRTAEIGPVAFSYGNSGLRFHVGRASGTIPTDGLLGARDFRLLIGTGEDERTFAIDGRGGSLFWDFTNHGLSWSVDDVVPFKLLLLDRAPTGADVEVTTGADTEYRFSADDFGFMDADGQSLASVKILDRPSRGVLKLDGAPLRAGTTVSRAQLDAGAFTWTPPRHQIGPDLARLSFQVSDGGLESADTYTMNLGVDRKLVGSLEQGAFAGAFSLPDTSSDPDTDAYAQRFRTGATRHALGEVHLGIAVPSGTTPRVSIWHGRTKPERKSFELANPANIHSAAEEVKIFKPVRRWTLALDNDEYWLVVERASGSGTITMKRVVAPNDDAGTARGWALLAGYKKRGSGANAWSRLAGGVQLKAELRTVDKRFQTRVTDMEISGPGPDELYTHGERLRITATFTEPVNISSAIVHVDPPGVCHRGNKIDVAWLPSEDSGNGTNQVHFDCNIHNGPYTRVAVMQNSLQPGNADVRKRVSSAHPAVERTTAVHGLTGPQITAIEANAAPTNGTWAAGDTIEISYTFSAPVTVATDGGTPYTRVTYTPVGNANGPFHIIPALRPCREREHRRLRCHGERARDLGSRDSPQPVAFQPRNHRRRYLWCPRRSLPRRARYRPRLWLLYRRDLVRRNDGRTKRRQHGIPRVPIIRATRQQELHTRREKLHSKVLLPFQRKRLVFQRHSSRAPERV